MPEESSKDAPRGFAGLMSMLTRVDQFQLQAQSEQAAKNPDPSIATIRDRRLGKWIWLIAMGAFFGWLASLSSGR